MHTNVSTVETLLELFDLLIISYKFAEKTLKYLLDFLTLGPMSELDFALKFDFVPKLMICRSFFSDRPLAAHWKSKLRRP